MDSIITEFLKDSANGHEFEVRFGKIEKDKFNSNVSKEVFDSMYNSLIKSNSFIDNVFTKEHSWNTPNGSLRQITILNTHKQNEQNKQNEQKNYYMLKTRINKKDVNSDFFDLRFSSQSETILNEEDLLKYKKTLEKTPNVTRNKQRISFVYKIGKIDMTIVNNDNYEIEFEINNQFVKDNINNNDNTVVVSEIKNTLDFILNTCINFVNKNVVLKEYTELLKLHSPKFVGAQPVTLQKEHLQTLYKELYSVTDKADGERFFMFITKEGKIYFIDNNLDRIIKSNVLSTTFFSCLVDGELIFTKSTFEFYAFDILCFNNIDIRMNTQYLFKQRFDKLITVMNSIDSTKEFILYLKKFIYRNVFLGSKLILEKENTSYNNDGLIYTPMNEPYPKTTKWDKLFKWKPDSQNTIDFFSIKNESNNSWDLYVQGHSETNVNVNVNTKQKQQTTVPILFDVEKLCKENTEKINGITYNTTFDNNLIDPVTNTPFISNTVIEYKWDSLNNKFVPIRSRPDKTNNPKKHGNYVKVACDIWKNIHNPVKKEDLFNMTNQHTEKIEKNFFFDEIKKSHKLIKDDLFKKYHQPCIDISINNNTLNYMNSKTDFKNLENKDNVIIVSFIDTSNLQNLKNTFCVINNEIIYYIEKINEDDNDNDNDNNSNYNNCINLYTNNCNENNLKNFIVNLNTLKKEMNDIGYDFVNSVNDKKQYLNEYEKNISSLYNFCVFNRKEKKIVSLNNNFTNINVSQNKSEKMITLNNIQFFKIKETHDIINLLNCLNKFVYDLDFKNEQIKDAFNLEHELIKINKLSQFNYVFLNEHTHQQLDFNKEFMCFYICNSLSEEEFNIYVVLNNNVVMQKTERLKNTIEQITNIQISKNNENENNENKNNENKKTIDEKTIDEKVIDEKDIVINEKVIDEKDIVIKEKDIVIKEKDIVINEKVNIVKNEMQNEKVTIKSLKVWLKKIDHNISISGNKDILEKRLQNLLRQNKR